MLTTHLDLELRLTMSGARPVPTVQYQILPSQTMWPNLTAGTYQTDRGSSWHKDDDTADEGSSTVPMQHQNAGHCLQNLRQLVEVLRHDHDKRQHQDDGCSCHSANQLWPTATLTCSDRNFWYCQPPAASINITHIQQQERYVPGCIQCGELTDCLRYC